MVEEEKGLRGGIKVDERTGRWKILDGKGGNARCGKARMEGLRRMSR